MNVYVHEHIQHVLSLHQEIFKVYDDFIKIDELLNAFSENLFRAYSIADPETVVEISNHHPDYLGQKADKILHQPFSLEDAQLTIAKEYGYTNWDDVPSQDIDHSFEQTVDLLLAGEIAQLKELLNEQPSLLESRSSFGHHATLLHYAGSNGVEIWRQQVPSNLPQIVQMLIELGAEKEVTANFYGGLYTTKELAGTSAHPKDAGIMKDLLNSLS